MRLLDACDIRHMRSIFEEQRERVGKKQRELARIERKTGGRIVQIDGVAAHTEPSFTASLVSWRSYLGDKRARRRWRFIMFYCHGPGY